MPMLGENRLAARAQEAGPREMAEWTDMYVRMYLDNAPRVNGFVKIQGRGAGM